MNLRQLEYIRAIARFGNVRKAASSVGVSPQAVSSAVGKLEAELGIRLVERKGRELCLTVQGHRFASESAKVLNEVDGLKSFSTTRAPGISPDGHFRLYVPGFGARGSLFINEAYELFVQKHNDIHLDVWHQSGATCIESLQLRISDAAITLSKRPDERLDFRELGQLELKAIVPADLACTDSHIDSSSLSSLKIAAPINFSETLAALSSIGGIDLAALKFRDVSASDIQMQADFVDRGGLIFTLSKSPLAAGLSGIREVSIGDTAHPKMTVYYCTRKGEWSDRHQRVYWHLLETLAQ